MPVNSLITSWISAEQMASASMFLAALLLFGAAFNRIWSATPVLYTRIWQVAALALRIGAFMILSWSLYFLLNNSSSQFSGVLSDLSTGGPTGRAQTKRLYTEWGTWVVQPELSVQHFVEKEYVEEINQGGHKPLLYVAKKRTEALKQESITSFDGTVNLHLVNPETVNYELKADYAYTIINQAEVETVAEFSFPLVSMHSLENLVVLVDDQPPAWKIESGRLTWQQKLSPKQSCRVEISYATRGTESFNYSVPNSRELRNYSLTIITDSRAIKVLSNPETNAVKHTQSANTGQGYTVNWKIDRAIMAPMLGVQFVLPAKPVLSPNVLKILRYAARALVLLLSLAAITLVICGLNVEIWRLALVGGIFTAQYLGLLVVYPAVNNYVWPVLVLGGLACLFDRLALRNLPRLPLILILLLAIVFGMAYPFAGLLPGERERNALDGAVQIGMIIYLFGLTLYTRVRNTSVTVDPQD